MEGWITNQLARTSGAELAVKERTKDLIVRGVSANTLKAYRQALKGLEAWMREPRTDPELTTTDQLTEQNQMSE